jgi:ribonuclease III
LISSSHSRNATSTTVESASIAALQAALGYRFDSPDLLLQALTHKSFAGVHNERLEFLGDAVLGYVVAQRLFEQRPSAHEDTMSLLRASLVRKETLAEVARELHLGDCLRLGVGVRRGGGHRIESILADALEAVIGAVHLDGGIEPARAVILHLLDERMANLDPESLKDAKTRLQELLQGSGLELPQYAIESAAGSAHARLFTVTCRVQALGLEVHAEGRSRRAAEKRAAATMLEQVGARLERKSSD